MARQDDRLTAHLRWSELRCRDGTPYPARWTQRAWRLAQVFEAIRTIWDRPISLGSAYRTRAYNASLPNSSPRSQHLQGLALDLYPPAGVPVDAFWAEVRLRALHDVDPAWREVGGLGRYSWGIHVDLRPRVDGRLAEWEG